MWRLDPVFTILCQHQPWLSADTSGVRWQNHTFSSASLFNRELCLLIRASLLFQKCMSNTIHRPSNLNFYFRTDEIQRWIMALRFYIGAIFDWMFLIESLCPNWCPGKLIKSWRRSESWDSVTTLVTCVKRSNTGSWRNPFGSKLSWRHLLMTLLAGV